MKLLKNTVLVMSSLLLFSCSNTSSKSNQSSDALSLVSQAERKNEIVKAFYEYTLSKEGFETAKANGGIIKDSDYLAAKDFNKNDYQIFSLNNSDLTIKVGGSTSVTDVSDAQIRTFISFFKENNSPAFTKDRKGSGTAVSGLETGLYDIAYLSRELDSLEKEKMNTLEGKTSPFCIDAVVPVVNKSNNLESITRKQLALIYGERNYLDTLDIFKNEQSITKFSDIDSSLPSSSISIYTRDSSSGTRECFTEKIGIPGSKKDDKLTSKATVIDTNGDMITSIKNDENGLGYVSLDSISGKDEVKALKLENVEATLESISDGSYLLQRYFNIVTKY